MRECELCSEQMKLSEQLSDALNRPSQAGHDLVATGSKKLQQLPAFNQLLFTHMHTMCLQIFINY